MNARLDPESQGWLTALEGETRLSTSDVLREALRHLHRELLAKNDRSRAALDALVGKYQGAPATLSERFKEAFTTGLVKKHGR